MVVSISFLSNDMTISLFFMTLNFLLKNEF